MADRSRLEPAEQNAGGRRIGQHRERDRAKVSTWLLAIARFEAISSLRRRGCENIDFDSAVRPTMIDLSLGFSAVSH